VLRLLTLLVFLAACTPRATGIFGSAPPTVRATPEAAAFEQAMFARLNRDRQARGLPALAYDERLADVARAHSFDMQRHDFFAHDSPTTGVLQDRMDRAGYLALEMRENLATAGDIDRAEDNLLKSPGHFKNIMATGVSHIGIGIVRGDAHGDERVLLITQVFARPAKVATPDEVAAAVKQALDAARKKRGLPPLVEAPLLVELASDHIGDLPEDLPDGAVGDLGERVSAALNEEEGHGFAAVQIAVQGMFDAEELDLPTAALDPSTTSVGIAAAPGHDERGRPRVNVLTLLGQNTTRN
jgi:uncharacterized protein YkwD